MKKRILTGWTITRVLYTLLGLYILIPSILKYSWIEALLGGYFAFMGIFSMGCASGNCLGGSCATNSFHNNKSLTKNIKFDKAE